MLGLKSIRVFKRFRSLNRIGDFSQQSISKFHVSCSKCNDVFKTHVKLIENGVKKLRIYDQIDLFPAQLDWNYLLDPKNKQKIQANNRNRASDSNINDLHNLFGEFINKLNTNKFSEHEADLQHMIEEIYFKATELHNDTHPLVAIGNYDKCSCVMEKGEKILTRRPTIDQIAKQYNWLREEQIGVYSTQRAHILKNELADLETALINYTLDYLNKKGFVLVSVPDILHHTVIESCGFPTKGERNQVYKLDYSNEYGKYCLSGTSEMSLGGLLKNSVFSLDELPLKLCAVSRCFRAEVSGSEKEGKLYRLHEFTKVEMFIVTNGSVEISNQQHDELVKYQIDLFSDLGFHFRVLDMSSEELGAPAFRKYDIEAWMPGTQFYGEISSTSNCTDYQSRRLHIYSTNNQQTSSDTTEFTHTLNGTACAIPRMLTSIIESNWDMDKKLVHVPEKLRPYLNNKQELRIPSKIRQSEPLHQLK